MPTYIHACEDHGDFEVTCRVAEWDEWKPCPNCGKSSQQMLRPSDSRDSHFPDPIVIHVSAEGKLRFPGDANAKVPDGYVKKELRTIREIEQLERTMNTQLRAEAEQHHENEDRFFSKVHSENRAELRMRMQSMSPLGRDFAKFAIEMGNRIKRKPTECGFHSEILHFDRSNREPLHDERTGWKRKYF